MLSYLKYLPERQHTLANIANTQAHSISFDEWIHGCSITAEPRLSDSCLSVPLIIRSDVQNFLKQVILNC